MPRKNDIHKADEEVIVTVEFYRNAKHLYRTAINYAKARIAHAKTLTREDWDEAERRYRLLRKALTRFNYGVDPLAAKGGGK